MDSLEHLRILAPKQISTEKKKKKLPEQKAADLEQIRLDSRKGQVEDIVQVTLVWILWDILIPTHNFCCVHNLLSDCHAKAGSVCIPLCKESTNE